MPSITGTVTSGTKGSLVPILTFQATGDSCCYSFSGIPQIYTDLIFVTNASSNVAFAAANFSYFQPDPTSNTGSRSTLHTYGTSAPTHVRNTGEGNIITGNAGMQGAPAAGAYIAIEFNDYTNTSKTRSYSIRYGGSVNVNDTGNSVSVTSGTYDTTGGLTQAGISSYNGDHKWTANTWFTFYGVRRAGQ